MGPVHEGLVTLLDRLYPWLLELLVLHGLVPAGYVAERMRTEGSVKRRSGARVEVRADVVLLLWPPGVEPTLANRRRLEQLRCIGALGELQLTLDEDRIDNWAHSFFQAFNKHLGPHLFLMPVVLDEELGEILREELALRVESMRVFVVTPSRVPRFDDLDPVSEPERVLLNSMFHVRGEADLPLVGQALIALQHAQPELRVVYREMLLSHIEESLIMRAVEQIEQRNEGDDERWPGYQPNATELKSYLYVRGRRQGLEEGRQEGRQEGELLGRARAVLELLRARGLTPSPRVEAALLSCQDPSQLQRWLAQALMIDHPEQLLE